MSDNPGIGKQVASSVVCTTHDCFILSSLPRSCLCDTYCTKLHPLGICESWREASRAAGVCAWTVHVMSHEWPCMLESICLLETYSREGDVWSKSLVIVDLKTQHSVETRIIGSEKLHHISEACMTSWGCGWMEIKVDERAFVFGTTSVTYATQQHQHRQWSHWVVRSEPSLFGWYYTIYTLRRRSILALHGRRLTDVLASHKDGNCLPLFYVSLHPSGDVDELKSWTSVDSGFFI